MLTSSFGCTSSPASVAITSFAFVFEDVPGPGLEDVDRELVVELARGDAVAGSRDALRLVGVEQPELGVHPCGCSLEPAEPARDGRRDRLAGDGEVGDRLAGLASPQLFRCRSGVGHDAEASADALPEGVHPTPSASRAAARAARRRRARRRRSPASRRTRRNARPSDRAAPPGFPSTRRKAAPARASSSRSSTVSVASFLLVPMTPLGPRLIQPATYVRSVPSTRPFALGIVPRCSSNGTPGRATPW